MWKTINKKNITLFCLLKPNSMRDKTNDSLSNLIFHYHNYDRKYYVQGKKDKYYSESMVAKAEWEVVVDQKFSYGFGSEYKYDWGDYKTLTFTSQTKGHLKNLGVFANAGFKFNDSQSISLHLRNDDHKETGGNQTYKINYSQVIENFFSCLIKSIRSSFQL